MLINWYVASNLLPGLVGAGLGPTWIWDGNGKRSGLPECEAGAERRDKVVTSKMLWARSFPTRENDIRPLQLPCLARIEKINIDL